MAWTAPKTFTSAAATSAEMNTHLRDNMLALTSWTSYTPTVGGTGWALGNGTVSGAYIAAGGLVTFRMFFQLGTTSTAGASALTLTLPVTCQNGGYFHSAMLLDSSTSTRYHGAGLTASSSGTMTMYGHTGAGSGAMGGLTTSAPFAWASGDLIAVTGTYQQA